MNGWLFLIELGGVVLLLAVLARVATRFGLSPIPLYLLAGLAFGRGGVVPLVTAEEFIEISELQSAVRAYRSIVSDLLSRD